MRRRRAASASWLLVAVLAACASRRGTVAICDRSPAAVAAAVERLIERDNAADLAGVLDGYADEVVWLPPSGEPLAGKAAIRARYEALFADFQPALGVRVDEARADGDLGFARGVTFGTLAPRDGGASRVVDDKFLALVRCERAAWRVSHLAWSPRPGSPP